MVFSVQENKKVQYRQMSFCWSIGDFSSISNKNGEHMQSGSLPMLKDDTCEWRLRIYPNGFNEQSKDQVSAYLQCIYNGTSNLIANYLIEFRTKERKILISKRGVQKFSNEKCWSLPIVITRSELLPLLIDDHLVCKCTVEWEINTDSSEEKSAPTELYAQANLSKDLYQLMQNSALSDVTLVLKNDTKFSAHKCLLAARSPIFATMFQQIDETRKSVVEINDVDAEIFKLMLEFIYTGKVDMKNREVEGLLATADKYGIEDLKLLCELELGKQLDIENAITLLLLSDRYSAKTLKTQALNIITNNLKDVLKTDAMKNLTITQTSIFYDILEAVAEKL